MEMQSSNGRWGAQGKDWEAVAGCGLTAVALPVVSNPKALPASKSTLKQLGKTPSRYNARRQAVGIRQWTSHVTSAEELKAWSEEPDYGICLRTGHGLIALDCDVDSEATAEAIRAALTEFFGAMPPERFRKNSRHFLVPIRCTASRAKAVMHMPTGTDMIEVLGVGQQFVAFGTHPSGAQYEWTGPLDAVPSVDADRLDSLLKALAEAAGAKSGGAAEGRARKLGETKLQPDRLADWLRENGYVLAEPRPGELQITCPWASEHSAGEAGDTSTTYFQAGTNGHEGSAFVCLHAHCRERNLADFRAWAEAKGFRSVRPSDFKPIDENAVESEEAMADSLLAARADKHGRIRSTLPNVACALGLGSKLKLGEGMHGLNLRYDTFLSTNVVGTGENGPWRPMEEADGLRIRCALEEFKGFYPIAVQTFRDAVNLTAHNGEFDSMHERMDALPAWDGVPRIEKFYSAYCGAVDSDYARALGRYTFAALAGRSWSTKDVKADIVPTLVGAQGIRKSTLVRALALEPEFSTEITFEERDDDNARKIAGMQTVEIPELAGYRKKEIAAVKRYLSETADTYIPKYQECRKRVVRRCVFFNTTNETDFLTDTTGNRRYAPIVLTKIDIEAVRRDIVQLYAEGLAVYKAEGVRHRRLEELAASVNQDFMREDPWAEYIAAFIERREQANDPEAAPLTSALILREALGLMGASCTRPDYAHRVGVIMQDLGYAKKKTRLDKGRRSRQAQVYCKVSAEGGDVPF
jgi:hypothetical protein